MKEISVHLIPLCKVFDQSNLKINAKMMMLDAFKLNIKNIINNETESEKNLKNNIYN